MKKIEIASSDEQERVASLLPHSIRPDTRRRGNTDQQKFQNKSIPFEVLVKKKEDGTISLFFDGSEKKRFTREDGKERFFKRLSDKNKKKLLMKLL
jgi:hypothetical protein